MKIYFRLVAFATLLALIPVEVNSAWFSTGYTIKNIRYQGDKARITFETLEDVNNPAGCGSVDHYGIDSANDPKGTLAILLSAYLTGKKISIFVLDNSCDLNGRPSVTNVLIGLF